MLCMTCSGTEHSPNPDHFTTIGSRRIVEQKNNKQGFCPRCGDSLWQPCQSCESTGRRLHVFDSCSHCGSSIPFWEPCPACEGRGKVIETNHVCLNKQKTSPLNKTEMKA
jgi:hypothetical protein